MGQRILMIDDDERLCDMLRDYLGAAGYRLRAAHSAAAGLGEIVRDAPDAVILDLRSERPNSRRMSGSRSGARNAIVSHRLSAGMPPTSASVTRGRSTSPSTH